MNDSSAKTNQSQVGSDGDAATDTLTTDSTGGKDKEWPDEAKILPDDYLGDDKK